MERSTPLTETQKVALVKLTAAVGPAFVEIFFLAAQFPDMINARVETFMQYETALFEKVQKQAASEMPT